MFICCFTHAVPEDFRAAPEYKASDMKIWYDRADLEETRDMWLSSAGPGLSALSDIERSKSVDEMKKRLSSWQWKRIEEEISQPDIQSLLSEIENKKKDYLYLFENGELSLDENGKPVFKGLSDLDNDISSWESELKVFINNLFNDWERCAEIKYDEVLSLEKGLEESEKDILNASFSEYRNSVKREFEYLYLAGRKNLITMRSKDRFSMKKESEDRGAEVEADKRIEEIQVSLKEASDSLEKNLTLMKGLNTEEAGAKINEWEEDFKKSFEQGLQKWEKAEKDFLAERMRWEKCGKEGYIEAEKEWDSAIEKFTEARRSWSVEMKGIIDEGRKYWSERELSFFESYREVTQNIEEASLKEKIRFEKELTGYLSVYRESRNIERMAFENIEYLKGEIARIERYKADKQRNVNRVYSQIDDIEDEIDDYERYISSAEKTIQKLQSGEDRRNRIPWLRHSIKLYQEKIKEQEVLLVPLYNQYNRAIEIRDLKNDELSSYRTELTFWENASVNYKRSREGAEESLLGLEEEIKSGVYGGSEFDSELNILKEKRDILKRKLDIAQHVYEYSLDKTSDRERKAETEKKYREALSLFKEKETSYENSITELDDFIENILSENEKSLEEKKTALSLAEKKLEDARGEYESAMEIFRLKDSSLLETTISNLEDENDSYLDEELENSWNDYFLHMEKLLRNERRWDADDLLEDIMGTSDEDNAEDLSNFEDRNSYLENLNPDFSNSETSDLKNEFTLKGFDTEKDLINKFFSSLESGDSREAEFFFELVKIQYKGELDTVNKGIELLSLDESEKSSSDLIKDIENSLAEKRKELFGDNYDSSDILSFLTNNSYDDLAIDTSGPDVLEKIKEIALLEAEIKGINKYSPYSSAFTLHERNELFEKLSDLYYLAEDSESASIGVSSSFETRDDIIDFYKTLKTYNVPFYIEEITGKILESIIKEKGFIFSEDLSSMENELNLYNNRIENYSADDPLSLEELEEKRDKLSLDFDTLNDLNNCYERSLENEYSNSENKVFETLIVKALNILKDESSIITTSDTVKEKRALIISKETEYKERNTKLADLRNQLKEWETEQAAYFNDNVADKKAVLEEAKEEISTLRTEYHDLLDDFTSLTNQYREKKTAVDNALNEFTMSKWDLYEAEELKDFADSPYKLENTDPEAVLDRRKAEFEKADDLYSEVLNIKTSLTQRPTGERFNSEYLDTLKDKKELLGSVNYLSSASETLSRNIAKAQEEAGRYYAVMKDSIGSIFKFTLPFKPDVENYNEGELTDFSSFSSETDIKNAVNDYFNKKDSEITFSNDALKWAKAISDLGSHNLKNFGLAFYAEYKNKVTVPLYSDQNYEKLKDYDFARYDPYNDTLNSARNTLNTIKNNPETYKLYSFFRAMHLSGNTTLDYSFMGKDISKISHDLMWNRCKSREHYIKKKHWWSNFWKRTAKKMKKMRHNMTDINGNYERNIIWEDIAKTFSSRESFLDKKEEIRTLTGSEDGKLVSFDDFIVSLSSISGELPDQAGSGFKDLLKNIYDSLTDDDKSSSYTLSVKTFEKLNEALSNKTAELNIITEKLEKEREENLFKYRADQNNQDVTSDEVKNHFINLFYESEYSTQESSEMSFSELLSSYSNANDLKGRERTLSFAADDLMRYFSSSVDISKHENDEKIKLQYLELKDKQGLFESRISELYETGVKQWKESFTKLIGKRKKWREDFQKEASLKEELWRDKYNILKENRNNWIEESTIAVQRGESRRLSREIGINADKLLSESGMIIIPDIKNSPDLENIVEEVTDSEKLSSLISAASYYSKRKESDNITLSSYLPDIGSFGRNDIRLENYAENLSNEVRKKAALLEALKMAKTVTEVEDGIADNIESANMSTEKSLADTLEGKGYRKRGNMFTRKAIIDMTLLGGIEEERHEIEAYHHFIAPEFETGVDLSRESLSSMGYEEIELKVQKAVTNLRRYSDLIFGSKTSRETANWKGFDEEFSSYVKNAEKSFNSSRQASEYKDTKGLFYMHLGYAPVMKSKDPEKIKTAGYGEYGRIYELYFRNEARLGRGIASLDQPWYSQKLWDDDKDNDGDSDGLFGAPSVRSIGNIAMTIVAGTGPLAFAINMIDDAAFTAMDIGSGITDWDDGMMSLGKQTAVGAVTQGIGSKYDKFKSDSFLATTGAAGIKTASTNLATTAINSFDLSSGGLYFNTNSFENNWKSDLYGKGAVSGYISSMGTAGLNSTLTGFYGEELKNGKALSSSIAGSAASIYEYNALGSTTLNVLNTTDILSFLGADNLIDDYGGVGLLEMGVGDGGSLFNFGTEGQNVSTSQIASAYQGINTYYQNAKISLSQKENIAEAKVAMRALYSRGGTDEEAMKLYTNLLSGKDNLKVGSTGGETAETTLNNNGGRTIRVASTGNNMMSRLRLGTVLGHEAHRDGEDSGQEVQESETVKAVYNHTGMALDMENDYSGLIASDKSLLKDVIRLGSTQNLNDYSESVLTDYDSTKDYWKVIKHIDGSITMVDDSSDDLTVVDEETGAEKLFEYTGGSKTGFISSVLGLSRDEINYRMGPEAGWSYIDGKWKNELDDKTVRFTLEQTEKISRRFRELNLIISRPPVTEGVFRKIGNALYESGSWISEKYNAVRESFNIKKYISRLIEPVSAISDYYPGGAVKPSEIISKGAVSQQPHTESTHLLENWYTRGHPAVDIVGEGSVTFPCDLELLKTGKNRNRLLYRIAGSEDYLYFTHLNPSDTDALQKLLEKSGSGSVFYNKGTHLFSFPEEKDEYSTDCHIHIEMYRKREDGSYGFADPLTGAFLPEFDYGQSTDGSDYGDWIKKLPYEKRYWR